MTKIVHGFGGIGHARNTLDMLALCSVTFPKFVEHILDTLAIERVYDNDDQGFDDTDMFPMGTLSVSSIIEKN